MIPENVVPHSSMWNKPMLRCSRDNLQYMYPSGKSASLFPFGKRIGPLGKSIASAHDQDLSMDWHSAYDIFGNV